MDGFTVRRRGKAISYEEKLLLEALVERGLSAKCAGKILGMTSSTRTIKKFREYRRARLACLSDAERKITESQEKPYI